MTHVCDLPRGWSLWADSNCHEVQVIPRFKKGHRSLMPLEMAVQPEAPEVFREIKRLLDIAERSHVPISDPRMHGLDVGRFSLQLAMDLYGKWEKSLLETGVA